jgi:hypothetical protein
VVFLADTVAGVAAGCDTGVLVVCAAGGDDDWLVGLETPAAVAAAAAGLSPESNGVILVAAVIKLALWWEITP